MALISYTDIAVGSPRDIQPINSRFAELKAQLNGNLDTNNLADGAVTTNKLGALAVTTNKLGALAVTDAKINDVNGSKLVENSVPASALVDTGFVTTGASAGGASWSITNQTFRSKAETASIRLTVTRNATVSSIPVTVATIPTAFRPTSYQYITGRVGTGVVTAVVNSNGTVVVEAYSGGSKIPASSTVILSGTILLGS